MYESWLQFYNVYDLKLQKKDDVMKQSIVREEKFNWISWKITVVVSRFGIVKRDKLCKKKTMYFNGVGLDIIFETCEEGFFVVQRLWLLIDRESWKN